ncbi:MAG TPA: homoserine dehydrogenase, partial [Spirochaetes bacterium]|nr:homoserine dehydrogenase [Spirochaetota bacterium]
MRKKINIGIVGFGTVGSGLLHVLKRNSELIGLRSDIDITVKTICDLDIKKVKSAAPGVTITDDWKSVTADSDIHTVVELIGGIEPAKTIILEALRAGKNVVTANKKLLAEEGRDIFDLLGETTARLGFEASVGGGIPCVLSLRRGMVGNVIKELMGILNGTTNYILTRMQEDGLSFDQALKDAQEKGFAEADPTFDIEGYDAGHKIALLSMLAYNKKIDYRAIPIEGITKIGALDILYAREMGYVIKLLGISKLEGGAVDIRVQPTMLPRTHPLASVRNEFNAVMFDGDMTGPVTLYGKGAGSHPTASAVVSDIVQIARQEKEEKGGVRAIEEARYLPAEQRVSRYYIRLHTEDRSGILTKISGVLARYDISIASVIQKESDMPHVPLVIMTHQAGEAGMMKAMEEIR